MSRHARGVNRRKGMHRYALLGVWLLMSSMVLAAPPAGGTVRFDFEKGGVQGWRRVVGSLPGFHRNTAKCPGSLRKLDTGKFVLATQHWTGGILESPVFCVKGPEATFLIGGTGKPHAFVSLHLEDGRELMRSDVPLTTHEAGDPWGLQKKRWDLSKIIGKKVFLRVVSQPVGYSLGKRGSGSLFQESFVVLDNFTVKGYVDKAASLKRIARLKADEKKSLDAIADRLGDIVYTVRKADRDGHWYANIGHWSGDPNRKLFHDGARLCRLDTRSGKRTVLLNDPRGGIRDPQVHYDGKKILFSYRPGGSEYYNLYEIGIDGKGMKRLTKAPYDDFEPSYFPDGRIVFVSTRCKRWVPCYFTEVAVLHSCKADGSDVRMLSANVEHENTPWPMPDGKIIYMRWEYNERNVLQFHHLWTANPDGTKQTVFYGNMHPGYVMIDAKPIKGSKKVACIFVPGHSRNEHEGTVTLVDPSNGPDDKSAIQNVGWSKTERDPYPIDDLGFLVAQKHEILLMDYQGRTRSIWKLSEAEKQQRIMCQEPRPIESRPRERIVPDNIDLTKDTGVLMLENVYEGRNMKGVGPGSIKKLMILEMLPKSLNVSNGSEPISAQAHNHERILGTVPVEADGSAFFEVPAMRAVFFVALDKDDRAVKRMQSFLTMQPGESASCVGCHEERTRAPSPRASKRMAMKRGPCRIEPIAGIPDVFDFHRDIQPILDKHCLGCHGYERTSRGGPIAGGVILSGDHGPVYSHSYSQLVGRYVTRGSQFGNNRPYATGSGGSRLMKQVNGGHKKVRLSDREKLWMRLWMDSGALYAGTLAGEGCGMIYSQIGRQSKTYRVGTYSSWFSMGDDWDKHVEAAKEVCEKRCSGCHQGPKIPELDVTKDYKRKSTYGFKGRSISTARAFNLTRPKKSLFLLAPLSKKAGGFQMCRKTRKDDTPVFSSTDDAGYKVLAAYMRKLHEAQNRNKRFNMPGFKPNRHYVREMKRYGIIPEDFDRDKDTIDVYAADRAYWKSFWHKKR